VARRPTDRPEFLLQPLLGLADVDAQNLQGGGTRATQWSDVRYKRKMMEY
jgi:hypothetical protein